jgi:hypothetical protein
MYTSTEPNAGWSCEKVLSEKNHPSLQQQTSNDQPSAAVGSNGRAGYEYAIYAISLAHQVVVEPFASM